MTPPRRNPRHLSPPPPSETLAPDAKRGKRLSPEQEEMMRWLIREAIRKSREERGR